MKLQTAQKLLKLNYDLYENHALDWDKTRPEIWEWPVIDFVSKIKPDSNILDLGCGNGRLYKAILKIKDQKSKTQIKYKNSYSQIGKNLRIDYLGIDSSKALIKQNQKKYNVCVNPHLSLRISAIFRVGDGLNLKDKNKYDYVFCLAVMHHIPSQQLQIKLLKNIHQALNIKGQLLLSVWNRWQPRYKKYFVSNSKSETLNFKQSQNSNITNSKHNFEIINLQSEIGPTDTIVPWKQTGKFRFVHAFTKTELANLAKKAGFKNIKTFYANKNKISDKKSGLNIYLICDK